MQRLPIGFLASLTLVACQSPSLVEQVAAEAEITGFECSVSVAEETVVQLCESEQVYLFDTDLETLDNSMQAMGLPPVPVVDRRSRPVPVTLKSFADAMALCLSLHDEAQKTDPALGPGCESLQLASEAACDTVPCEKLTMMPPPARGSPDWLGDLDLEDYAKNFLEELDDKTPRMACAHDSNRIICDILELIHDFDPDGRFIVEPISHLDVIPQHSILATLPAGDVNSTSSILIGAHVDSWSGSPGVEDNLSGVIAALTMMKTIVDQEIEFGSGIHFAFFAGEEGGKIGSCRIRKMLDTQKLLLPMKAALNFDMVGRGISSNLIYVAEPGSGGYNWQAIAVQEIAERHFEAEDIKVVTFEGAPSSDNVTWGTACKPVAAFRKVKPPSYGDWYHKPSDTWTEAKALDRLARLGLVVIWEID
jgi:hypothetical protein